MARIPKLRKAKPRVALVGDGETEQIYFANVKDTDRPADLDLFPTLPRKKGTFQQVLNRAMELAPDYTKVFALVDMDAVVSDGHLKAYGIAKHAAQCAGVIVLENNPCFEIWFLLHFVHTGRSFTRCGEVEAELKRPGRIPEYAKTKAFLTRAALYANYKTVLQSRAIPHARLLENNRPVGNDRFPRAQVYQFFEWYFDAGRLEKFEKKVIG